MLFRIFYIFLCTISIATAADFSDPAIIDTSGMSTPKPRDDDGNLSNYDLPLLINRKLGLHSGYLPGTGDTGYSTGVAASFTSDISDIISFGFQRLHTEFKPDTFLNRFILANTYYYAMLPIYTINDITRYQWAVASKYAAVGIDTRFWDLGVDAENSINHGRSVVGLWTAPFRTWYKSSFSRALSLKRYAPIPQPQIDKRFTSTKSSKQINEAVIEANKTLAENIFIDEAPSVSATEYTQLTEAPLQQDWNIVRLAAGFNDQSDYAREIQNKAYWHEAHYLDGANYLRVRSFLPLLGIVSALQKTVQVTPLTEQSDNLTLLEAEYAAKNIDLSSGKVAMLSILGTLCSSSFYRSFKHVNWEYYDQGNQFFRAYEWKGIRIPDVVPYLNTNGISYHLTTGYRVSPTLAIPLTLEYQLVGKSQFEASIGIMKRFPQWLNLDVQASILLSSEGVAGNTSLSIAPWGSACVDLGFAYYNTNTLEGKRRALSLQHNDWDYELFVKISLLY